MDLVDEEDRPRLERGEQRGDVALSLERRAGGLHERHVELGGDDLASDVFPSPGGPASSTWSSASPRADAAWIDTVQLLAQPSWPTNSSSVRGRSERSSSSSSSRTPGVWMRSTLTTAHPAARWPAAPPPCHRKRLEQRLGLGGREAELEQALAGDVARVVAAGHRDRLLGQLGLDADLLAQLDHDPLGGAPCRSPGTACRRATSPATSAATSSRGVPAAQHRERDLRPNRLHADQQEEEVALSSVAKP
jgi:hypothetical protein